MSVTQVSVFIENREGRLAEVSRLLSGKGINIRSLSLADSSDFGVLRLIVDNPEQCIQVLQENGFVARATPVLALEIEDRPGGLDRVLSLFSSNGINVEYMYAFVEKSHDNAIVIFKTGDNGRALDLASREGIPVIRGEALFSR
ncbi:MAG TPA: amino acid-binding protein [Spirochaetota bacterium]|nr:amino acid-binding protein [Spirochaetota bacterium]